jgi:hypothetical protein
MRIVHLETVGVRGLVDGAFTFAPERGGQGHVTVVTGPPHAGLTTFLDAIALSAAQLKVGGLTPDSAAALRAGGSAATIRSTYWLEEDERKVAGVVEETTDAEVIFRRGQLGRAEADPGLLALMSRYTHAPELSKVVLIPARRVSDGSFPALSDFEVDQGYKHLSPSPEKFAGLPYALMKDASGFGRRERFAEVQKLFSELVDSARLAGVGPLGQLDFSLRSGLRVPLPSLDFTERNAFVLAALPVVLGLQRSIILLDTPEMGLAPGVAARWLEALRAYTPEAQWIIATRDPAVIALVDPAARIDLGARSA